MRTLCILGVVAGLLFASDAQSRQVTLEPSTSVTVVNPNAEGEAVVLYQFTLPEWSSDDVIIVRALISWDDIGENAAPFLLSPAEAIWTTNTTWAALQTIRGDGGSGILIDPEEETDGAGGRVTSVVQDWVTGTKHNYGIVVSKRLGYQTGDVGDFGSLSAPTLTVIFTEIASE